MKWVKASERLPEAKNEIFFKYSYPDYPVQRISGALVDYGNGKKYFISGGLSYDRWEFLEWLEESIQDVPDINGGEMQYKPGDIPTDQEDRIKMDTDQYINLHYTNATVRTAVYWGCIAAARREYLLARRTAIAATQHPETPALGEVLVDIKEWMDNYAEYDAADDDSTLWRNGAIAMYHNMQAALTEAIREKDQFKEWNADTRKELEALIEKSLKISEERDVFRKTLEVLGFRLKRVGETFCFVIVDNLLKKYPKQ